MLALLVLAGLCWFGGARLLVGQWAAASATLPKSPAELVGGARHHPRPHQSPTAEAHRVVGLPGLPANYTAPQFAGHVPVAMDGGPSGSLFYWLVEASQVVPARAPLVVWLNGGPGCSSMEGLLVEHGPWTIQPDGATLQPNPYAWNRLNNVLYIDQPIGTGLSVADGAKFATSQTQVDELFADFLHKWLAIYPAYRDKPIWFAGESYAGRYIPSFVTGILEGRGRFAGLQRLSIKGVLIGNGWTHPLVQIQTMPEYAYNQGLVDWQARHFLEQWALECGLAFLRNATINPDPLTPLQARLLMKRAERRGFDEELRYERDVLEALREQGASPVGAPLAVPECHRILAYVLALSGSLSSGLVNVYDVRHYDTQAGHGWPPSQAYMKHYLNTLEVRRAIHALELYEWDECNLQVNTALALENLASTRPQLVKLLHAGLPVLLYNGQFDFICNHAGTEAYLSTMGSWQQLKQWLMAPRTVWNVDGSIAGYAKSAGSLTFLLVLGASHMAPINKPRQVLDMLERFMAGQDFHDVDTLVHGPFDPVIPFIPGDVQLEVEREHASPSSRSLRPSSSSKRHSSSLSVRGASSPAPSSASPATVDPGADSAPFALASLALDLAAPDQTQPELLAAAPAGSSSRPAGEQQTPVRAEVPVYGLAVLVLGTAPAVATLLWAAFRKRSAYITLN